MGNILEFRKPQKPEISKDYILLENLLPVLENIKKVADYLNQHNQWQSADKLFWGLKYMIEASELIRDGK